MPRRTAWLDDIVVRATPRARTEGSCATLSSVRFPWTLAVSTFVAIGCGSFGEGSMPSAPNDGGTSTPDASDAGELGPTPTEEPVAETVENTAPGSVGCLAKNQNALFCSDFGDPTNPWIGWERPNDASSYAVDPAIFRAEAPSGRVTISGPPGSSPDARLRHVLPARTHFFFTGSLRLESGTSLTDAVLLKLQFAKGSLSFRSSGRVVETIPRNGGESEFLTKLPNEELPAMTWLDVKLEVDLPTGEFVLTVNGARRTAVMSTQRKTAEPVMLITGASDPPRTSAPNLTVWLDDIVVTSL